MSSLLNTTEGTVLPMLPASEQAAAAFEALRARLLALPAQELRTPAVDVPWAVSLTVSALPRIEPLRSALAALPGDCVASLDELKSAAFALYYAHLMTLPALKDEAAKKALLDEAKVLRSALLEDAGALARRGLIDATHVAKIKSGTGQMDTAGDLIALGALLHAAWPDIEDKTAATLEEIERAGVVGTALVVALNQKSQTTNSQPTFQEMRSRAFTFLWRHYENCRRGVTFLRHFEGGNTEAVMPSLFTRRVKKSTPAARDVVVQPVAP